MTHKSPLDQYMHDIAEHGFLSDDSQLHAVKALNAFRERLCLHENSRANWLARMGVRLGVNEISCVKGLYLWGGVGRGKTYLMDLFYESLPFERKLRTHFHRFMRSIHAELKMLKGTTDPLEQVAELFSKRYRVICFDEFFVVDITDAMILANLLDGLFRRGVSLVATSNIAPAGLYENGLQRARFLPAITLLERHTDIVNVDGGTDYRLRTLKQAPLYYFPCGVQSRLDVQTCFDKLCGAAAQLEHDVELEVEGRCIDMHRRSDDLAWFDFYALCDGPRSQIDYIEIAREFHTVIISNVPFMGEKNDDQARRFIYLVDEFYDRGVKLILEAEAHFTGLYSGGRLAFEFERTVSRIQEMQSEMYLAREHAA
ncbi:MAG: cell division protein ZapE [Flavobacteriales bacterium]|jgi:cell division protein ZapE